jgi:hypothetical protein
MGATRRKRARNALVFALAFVPFEYFAFASTIGIARDPLSILVNVAISLAFAFPFGYLFFLVEEKIWSWWRTRRPLPIPPAAGSVESFHWTGRPARTNVRRTGTVLAFFAIAIASLLLLPAPESAAFQYLRSVLIWVFVVFLGLMAIGTVFMMRSVTLEVDERGVLTRGMGRADFSIRWEAIGRIEFFSMEKLYPFAFSTRELDPGIQPMRMYALLETRGQVVGHLQPRGILGRELANRLEAALVTNASRRGIPIAEVRWRDSVRWRKRKVPRKRETRAT